jgi:hypothetical protein
MCKNKDAVCQYTSLYCSNHELLHVWSVQGSQYQAVCFRYVKEENDTAIYMRCAATAMF